MKAPLITLILTAALTLLVACSASTGRDSDNADINSSINPDGSCTQDYIRNYNEVVIQAKNLQDNLDRKMSTENIVNQAQILKNACDRFYAKHNNINCKVDIDNSKVKIASATHKRNCDTARQIIDSNQNSSN